MMAKPELEDGWYWVRWSKVSPWEVAQRANSLWWRTKHGGIYYNQPHQIGPRLISPQESEE